MDLTSSQQTSRVALLGVTFMIMFTAFNSLQNMVSKIYADYGYGNLGQISVLVLYFVFGVSTLFTPFFIKSLGFKKSMFISSMGYVIFQGVGLVIALWQDIPKILGWIIVLLGACLCGMSAALIWVAQGSYVSQVAGQSRKTELFGLFWSLMMSSQIVGNIITTFVLGLVSTTVYFLVLTVLGFSSAFLFLLLPDVQTNDNSAKIVIKDEVKKVFALLKDSKYFALTFYYFFPGLCVGFYATFLSKLVKLSLPQNIDEIDDDYNKRISFYSGLVFISLGVSQALTGLFMKQFGQGYNKFKLAITGTIIVEIAGFVSLLCYFLQNYPLCFAVSFLWGASQTFIQTNTGALIGKVFPGKVQSFSVFRIVFAVGVVTTIILNITLKQTAAWVFLTIVMVIQVITSNVSIHISDLSEPQRKSLLGSTTSQ